jgi:hypothetical protein
MFGRLRGDSYSSSIYTSIDLPNTWFCWVNFLGKKKYFLGEILLGKKKYFLGKEKYFLGEILLGKKKYFLGKEKVLRFDSRLTDQQTKIRSRN